MTWKWATYYKALLLLAVFSMNSLVGFACSFGGFFHSLHHQATSVSSTLAHHQHSTTGHHHQEEGKSSQDHHNGDARSEKDDCCSEELYQVEKLDKSVARPIDAPKLILLTSYIASFPSLYEKLPLTEADTNRDQVRWRILSTIPDLRIAIQSFQI